MPKIRLETENLQGVVSTLNSNATNLSGIGNTLFNLGKHARSYDNNTFGPQILSICANANTMSKSNSINLGSLSRNLTIRTTAFLTADNAYGQLMHRTLTNEELSLMGNHPRKTDNTWIWDDYQETKISFDSKHYVFDPNKSAKQELGFKFPVWKDQVWEKSSSKTYIYSSPKLGGLKLRQGFFFDQKALSAEAGLEAAFGEDGINAGGYVEGSAYEGSAHILQGTTDLGHVVGGKVTALEGEAFAGIRNNSLGAKAGINIVSVELKNGVNILGLNIGIKAEAGLKAEVGASIGSETELALGPFTFGLVIGKAIGN